PYDITRKFQRNDAELRNLVVLFPDRELYVGQKVLVMGLLTSLFVILLLAAFAWLLWLLFRMKKVSEMKNDFINHLSHELRTPLASLMLAGKTLRLNTHSEKEQNYADLIVREGKRLNDQIDRVLEMASADASDFQLIQEDLNLHDLVEESCDRLKGLIEGKKAQIRFQFKAAKADIQADALHLGNAIFNLLENALKHNDQQPEITIVTHHDDAWLSLDVHDNGPGVSEKLRRKIFQRFVRNQESNKPGFGLGLSYVKQVVEGHAGRVEILESALGGACFRIYIPSS
ncbi:MAG: HAMP domain-containing sensor histidine kinase, partial [Bacteroidota bacterium]